MNVRRRNALMIALVAVLAVALGGCGSESVSVSKSDPTYKGATLFAENCSGCHTIAQAGTQGSKPSGEVNAKDRTNGPNFNTRHVSTADALMAIRGGGFSGAIMPGNIVTGADAVAVAEFLNKYSGREATHN